MLKFHYLVRTRLSPRSVIEDHDLDEAWSHMVDDQLEGLSASLSLVTQLPSTRGS